MSDRTALARRILKEANFNPIGFSRLPAGADTVKALAMVLQLVIEELEHGREPVVQGRPEEMAHPTEAQAQGSQR